MLLDDIHSNRIMICPRCNEKITPENYLEKLRNDLKRCRRQGDDARAILKSIVDSIQNEDGFRSPHFTWFEITLLETANDILREPD